MAHPRFLFLWLLPGCLLIAAMVAIGGITRLTHSGLSMVEWNMVLGSLPPLTEAQWHEPFRKYRQSPEYQLLNAHFTLQEFKNIYWWEYIHRFLGRTIGLVFLLPFVLMWVRGWLNKVWKHRLLALLLLGAFQGVLGWYMVKSGLVKNPYVSHYRLAAHLLSAFLVFGYTFWLMLKVLFPAKMPALHLGRQALPRSLPALLLGVVCLQVLYGAFVAGLKAGYAYTTFPKMGPHWVSPDVWAMQPWWLNLLEGGAGVQFVHRCLALVILVLAVWLGLAARRLPLPAPVRTSVKAVLLVVSFQFCLGVATLVLAVPVWLGVLHQMGALLLFASVLLLHFHTARTAVSKSQQVLQAA